MADESTFSIGEKSTCIKALHKNPPMYKYITAESTVYREDQKPLLQVVLHSVQT